MKSKTCAHCSNFKGEKGLVEAQLPGLLSLSSLLGSTGLNIGVCDEKSILLSSMDSVCRFFKSDATFKETQ